MQSHFMPAALLQSQLATLEVGDDVTTVHISAADDEASAAVKALMALKQAS
jgi:gluconate kinase